MQKNSKTPGEVSNVSDCVRRLVFDIASALVDQEELLVVGLEEVGASSVIRITVAATETGKIIGRAGRTARSIRTLLSGISMKQGHHFMLHSKSRI